MKKSNFYVKRYVVFVVLLLVVFLGGCYFFKVNDFVYLTQFAPTTSRQMMGYGVKTKGGKLILIDGGTKDDAGQLEQYIRDNGGIVDAWFITHIHSDHAGAFGEIAKVDDIDIGTVYLSINDKEWYELNEPSRKLDIDEFFAVIDDEKIKSKIVEPSVGDVIKIDNTKSEILGVKNPEIVNNAINNSSMVIRMSVSNKKILFLGDTGTESSAKLIASRKDKLKADFVQVAHHGQSGATEELYNIVKPRFCLWPTPIWLWNNDSNGTEDSGPWKTKETRKWIDDLGVEHNYVAKDGTQVIKIF